MRNNQKAFRKLTSICLSTAVLLLTGCGSQSLVESSSYQEEYLPQEDYNYHSFTWLQTDQDMVQTEDGYYFIAGRYLFFMDWETGESMPLCFKTDCLHYEEPDQEKITYCDAFLGSSLLTFLGYYQEHLYTICLDRTTGKSNLVEMNLDGSERKIVYSLSDNAEPSYMFMHRGVIYFFSTMKNLEGVSHYGLNALSVVSGSQQPVQVYTGCYEDGWLEKPLAYQNYIFFADYHYAESAYEGKLLVYDIRTGETAGFMEDYPDQDYYIYGADDGVLLLRSSGRYYEYSLADGTLTPMEKYDAFLDAHPRWQCHLENFDEDMALFTCYDLDADDFIQDSYVVNSQGEVIAIIPEVAWSLEGCYIYERDSEEYLIRRSKWADTYFIKAYAKSDLLRGIINPITFLEVDDEKELNPAYLIKIGGN